MTLAERMARYRAKELITQGELSKRCGVSLQTIYSIEKGLQEPSLLTKAKIERVIGEETDVNNQQD